MDIKIIYINLSSILKKPQTMNKALAASDNFEVIVGYFKIFLMFVGFLEWDSG